MRANSFPFSMHCLNHIFPYCRRLSCSINLFSFQWILFLMIHLPDILVQAENQFSCTKVLIQSLNQYWWGETCMSRTWGTKTDFVPTLVHLLEAWLKHCCPDLLWHQNLYIELLTSLWTSSHHRCSGGSWMTIGLRPNWLNWRSVI